MAASLNHGSLRAHLILTSILMMSIVNAQVNIATLAEDVRDLKEMSRQRNAQELQQRAHITRLTENLQLLTASMERYVMLLEDGQAQQDGAQEGVNSCTAQFALIQSKLDALEGKVNQLQGGRGVPEEIDGPRSTESPASTFRPPVPSSSSTSSCTLTPASIQPAQTINSSSQAWGYWGRDVIRDDSILYVTYSAYSITTLFEFLGEEQLGQNDVDATHQLPFACTGTGHVVRDRIFFCAKYGNHAIMKYDLDADSLVSETSLSSQSSITRTYQNGEGIDLAADDSWLWAVYSQESLHTHVQLAKFDPETMEMVGTWETPMTRTQIGQTFMICGVLYSLASYSDSPSYIKHFFNERQNDYRVLAASDLVMPTTERQCWNNNRWPAYIAMLNYNHWDQSLYAWNCGHLEKYPIHFAQPLSWLCRNT